ncbi:hypothetical protein EMIT07CA2_50107 [Brevibacillus sp. IT-7CA2]
MHDIVGHPHALTMHKPMERSPLFLNNHLCIVTIQNSREWVMVLDICFRPEISLDSFSDLLHDLKIEART